MKSWRHCQQKYVGVTSPSMESVSRSRKLIFVLGWGVLFWGGSTALTITLFDWYTARRIGPIHEIVFRFLIFMVAGVLWGLFIWKKRNEFGHAKPTAAGKAVRLALFVALMIGLCYLLWKLARH